MLEAFKDTKVTATFVAGLVVAFVLGAFAAGNTGLTGMVSGDSVAPAPGPIVEKSVEDYIKALSQGQADVEVVEMADAAIPGLKKAVVRVSIEGPNGTSQSQESTIYVTKDGKQAFLSEPADLSNPPQLQRQPAQPQR